MITASLNCLPLVVPLVLIDALGSEEVNSWQPIPADGVIRSPGNYFLEQDLTVKRMTGLQVESDDVALDLRGFALRFAGAPREKTYGIVISKRNGVSIRNGTIGGFWFNVHATDCTSLSIEKIKCTDIPYLAINCARGRRVAIRGCDFAGFRYDIPKPRDKYLIGVNLGGEDVFIGQNRFHAEVPRDTPDVETVLVLLSAGVTRDCIVGLNTMSSTRCIPRSYGVWIASDSQATVVHNHVKNVTYGVSVGGGASASVHHNRIEVEPGGETESYGIYAMRAKEVTGSNNVFRGVSVEMVEPELQ